MKKILGLVVIFEESCSVCKGTQKEPYWNIIKNAHVPCGHCKGTGTRQQQEILSIDQIKKLLGLEQ
jgi:DnaJ-class molecular chaperone